MEYTKMIILAQRNSKIYPNTDLPITLWLYENSKEKIIYMQNNYNKYTTGNDLVPISIDKKNPKLLKDIKLNISPKDLKKVFKFIRKKYKSLIDVINCSTMDYSIMEYTYINKFQETVIDGFFTNTIVSKHHKDLPVDLILYCNYIEYDDKRNLYTLLMVNNYKTKYRLEDCITVSIDKQNPKLVYNVKLGIKEEDFNKVKEFIKKNYDLLDKYIKNKVDVSEI